MYVGRKRDRSRFHTTKLLIVVAHGRKWRSFTPKSFLGTKPFVMFVGGFSPYKWEKKGACISRLCGELLLETIMRISKGRGGGGGRKNAAPPSVIARLLVWRSLWPSFACVVTLAVAWRTNVLYTETASTRIIASTTASTSSPTTPWQDSLAKPPGNDTTASLPDWIEPYTGQAFQAFRERIDDKIAARRAQMALQQDEPCTFPLFKGGRFLQWCLAVRLFLPVIFSFTLSSRLCCYSILKLRIWF